MASRREQAGLPSYPAQRWTTLQAMKDMKLPATNDEISEALADALQLSGEQRSVMHVGDRITEVSYCAAWARTGLRAAGAIDRVSRALWTVTSEGRQLSSQAIEQRYASYLARVAAEKSKSEEALTGGGTRRQPSISMMKRYRSLTGRNRSCSKSPACLRRDLSTCLEPCSRQPDSMESRLQDNLAMAESMPSLFIVHRV